MNTETNFWVIWIVYLIAGVAFYSLFWLYIKIIPYQLTVFLARGLMAALIFTPWSVNIQASVMAPALMVVMLDLITIGPSEAVRAGIPLFLSVLASGVVSIALYFSKRNSDR